MATLSPSLAPSTALLTQARAGNSEALGQLTERYRPYLLAIAARLLAGQRPSDASSVVQEGLLAAVQKWSTFRGQSPAELLGWLAAIVKHKAIRRLQVETRLVAVAQGDGDGAPIAADDPSPSEFLSRREQAALVREALSRLPQRDQQIIELRNFEERSYADIAAIMNCSEQAARQAWVRALRKLREELGGTDGG